MMRSVGDIDWRDAAIGIPALLTITLMPFTYSITNGVAAGFVSYSLIKLMPGQGPGRPRRSRTWCRSCSSATSCAGCSPSPSAGSPIGSIGGRGREAPPSGIGPHATVPSAYQPSSSPSDRARLLLAEQRRADPAARERPDRAAPSSSVWIAAPPANRNISRSAPARSASGYGCAPSKRTNGTISVGAAPSTASLRARRRGDRRPRTCRRPRDRRATRRRSRPAARAWPAPCRAPRTARGGCGAAPARCTRRRRPRSRRGPGCRRLRTSGSSAERAASCSGDSRNRSSAGVRTRSALPRPRRPTPQAADDRRRGCVDALPITSAGRRRHLIGERHHRHVERAARCDRRSRGGRQRGHAGHPDRDVDEALAPRPTERVGDHHAEAGRTTESPG